MGRGGLVIGIGNPDRGDDGAGRAVARAVCGRLPAGIGIVETNGEAAELMTMIEGRRRVFLIDASISGVPPGTVRRFDASGTALPYLGSGMSTHGIGLGEAIELSRALGSLPPICIVYVIEGASFNAGAGLSPPVALAIGEVAARVAQEVGEAQFPQMEALCTKPT